MSILFLQRSASEAYELTSTLKANLIPEETTMKGSAEVRSWIADVVTTTWQDARCGDGRCEAPFEYPEYGRFGCKADCNLLKSAAQITPIQIDVYFNFSHPKGSVSPIDLMNDAAWNLCPMEVDELIGPKKIFHGSDCYYEEDQKFDEQVGHIVREIDDVPDFCAHVNERQFRAVPAIIRGSITLESLNHCVAVLNRLVVDKYQLLSLDQRELMTIKTSEKALAIRKQWESQRWSDDSGDVDVFSDQDFSVYPEMDGIEAQTWREVIQVLKHMNLIAPVKTTRAYTLLANEHCSADVQNWAQASAERLRKKLREGILSTQVPYVKDGPGAVAGVLRSKLRAKSPARVSFA